MADPADDPDRAAMLSSLGLALRILLERTADRADLDAAVTVGQRAVAAIPTDYPDHAICAPPTRTIDNAGPRNGAESSA